MSVSTVSNEIARLFSDMSLVSWLLLTVGFILITVEFFQPTRSILASCGVASAIAGIAARMLCGGSEGMFFIMVIGFAFLVYVTHVVMLVEFKRDWLMQSAYLNVAHVEPRPLPGLEGVACEDINTYGHILADDRTLYVISAQPIPKGARAVVERVEGDKIFAKPV